jgi:hypothetical protein
VLHQIHIQGIVIGKTAIFEPWPSLEDSARFDLAFTLEFAKIILLEDTGGPGPCMYVPPGQGVPGIVFPFCYILQLAELQWTYSNLCPHGKRRV